jgi:hypothetical protein
MTGSRSPADALRRPKKPVSKRKKAARLRRLSSFFANRRA